MFKILIVDDSPSKLANLKSVVNATENVEHLSIDECSDIQTARLKCLQNQYDILLLDLYIREIASGDTRPEYALEFLNYLSVDVDVYKPNFVIGITEYEGVEAYRKKFENQLYYLLSYRQNEEDWKLILKNKIRYLNDVKNRIKYDIHYDFDVAIITALKTPEFEQMKVASGIEWKEITSVANDQTTIYYFGVCQNVHGKSIRIVAAYADQMGMSSSALLTTKLIYTFRPRYVIMTGICAGVGKEVNSGDIIVANQTWNMASGKIKEGNGDGPLFLPDPHYEVLVPDIKAIIDKLSGNSRLLFDIRESYPTKNGLPSTMLNVHCGDCVSSPAVIEEEKIVDLIKEHQRKLMGLEMEAYGMYYACNHGINPKPISVAIKSACDKGKKGKNDDYQEYCAFVSAKFAWYLIKNELKF